MKNTAKLTFFCSLLLLTSCSSVPSEQISDEPTSEATSQETSNELTTSNLGDGYNTITIAEANDIASQNDTATTERYYILGKVDSIDNATYGSMTISDETGSIYVFGSYSADGVLRYSEMDSVPVKGDDVLLYATLQNYKGENEIASGWIIEFIHNKPTINEDDYTSSTIQEARNATKDSLLKVSGVVARKTYANGFKESGFFLVDNTASIYVYDSQITPQVKEGNYITVAAKKDYWILETEANNAEKWGYEGCNQLTEATLLENDNKVNEFDKSWIEEKTVKDILNTPLIENITTNIYKVTAVVKKAPGNGFTNYYIDDLDGITGSYVYTQCNGNDFEWLDEFDNKVCSVYLSVINAKMSGTGYAYRFLPIEVSYDENYEFDYNNAHEFVFNYYIKDQFKTEYYGDPELEVITSVNNEYINLNNFNITYASSDTSILDFKEENDKLIMHITPKDGSHDVKITANLEYNSKIVEKTITVKVIKDTSNIETLSIEEAILKEKGEEVTIKGIVSGSTVNQKGGFFLVDETGVIAVKLASADDLKAIKLGNEVIVSGTRDIYNSNATSKFGTTCVTSAKITANLEGNHEYDRSSVVKDKTLADIVALDATKDYSTTIYELNCNIKFVESTYYSNIYVVDGSTELLLYTSSGSQYNWLTSLIELDENGSSTTKINLDLTIVNWNGKNNRGSILSFINPSNNERVLNSANF